MAIAKLYQIGCEQVFSLLANDCSGSMRIDVRVACEYAAVTALLMTVSMSAFACSSDFNCGMGNRCVKAPLQSTGVCMQSVDEYGMRQYNLPSLDSINPNMNLEGQCSFSTDCPIGFECHSKLKACVKR